MLCEVPDQIDTLPDTHATIAPSQLALGHAVMLADGTLVPPGA